MKYYYQLVYDEESIAYSRYLTHIRLFAQRLVSGKQLPEEASRLLYDQIAQVCTSEFSCVAKVKPVCGGTLRRESDKSGRDVSGVTYSQSP